MVTRSHLLLRSEETWPIFAPWGSGTDGSFDYQKYSRILPTKGCEYESASMPDELARLQLAGIRPLTWAKVVQALGDLPFSRAGSRVHMPSYGKRNNVRRLAGVK